MSAVSHPRLCRLAIRRRRERGFALLEILVAFVILAIGLSAIFVGVAVAMRSDGRTQVSRNTLRMVQSRLEAAGLSEGLTPGRREGRIGNRYVWQQTVTSVQAGPASRDALAATVGNNPVATFWVEVSVRAGDGTVATLAGLKLATISTKP